MLAIIAVAFFAGLVVRRVVGRQDQFVTAIDVWVIRFALPVLIVSKMSRASIAPETLVPVAIAWSAMVVAAVCIVLVGRHRSWPSSAVGAVLMVGVLGNTSFLGLGVVGALLGERHLPSAISYDQLGTFLALATYGSLVAGRYGKGQSGWRAIGTRLVRFPPFIALCSSPLMAFADPPSWVFSVLDLVGITVAPLAMFGLGWRFSLGAIRQQTEVMVVGLCIKMLLVPAGVLGVMTAVGASGRVEWHAALLQSAAPPMVTAGAVAVAAGLDAAVATSMVGVGTLLSFVTIPLWWLVVR